MLGLNWGGQVHSGEEQGGIIPKENLAPGTRWNSGQLCPFSLTEGVKGRPHLVQEEVWLLNLSQGVSEEAEHKLLHLEPVNSPQLLSWWGGWGHVRGFQSVMSLAPLRNPGPAPVQPYPLVLEEKLLELRK